MKKLLTLIFLVLLVSAPAYAQKSFDMRYNEAVEYYTAKQFDKAIKVLEAAKKSPGVTKDQIDKATRLIKQCQSSKQKMSDLNLSKESIFASGLGQTDSIYVTAGKAWEVTSCPNWCNTWQEADVLFIEVLPNDDPEPKKGIIEVTMGKERTAYLMVNQERRLDVNVPVRIVSVPERAVITIDNNPGVLSEDFVILEGKHRIRLEKSGFERKDTTVVLDRNDADGIQFAFKLEPQFATISVDIKPAEGFVFDANPSLDISGNEVNLYPNSIKSFNVDQELSYYNLYEGDVIPLHPGQYIVKASAAGFVAERKTISAERGRVMNLEFVLQPVTGTLSVSDEENARDAVVFVDDKQVGTIPLDNVSLKTGTHVMRIEKPDFITDNETYEIDIYENKNTEFKASMQYYRKYNITSDPAYCKVYMDGYYEGTTPIDLTVREGTHVLRFEKNGYYPQSRMVSTDKEPELRDIKVALENSYPLTISADKDSLGVIISKGNGRGKVVYAEGVKTPATVLLPLSKKPYQVELTRYDSKTMYKGNIRFAQQARNHVKILTWEDGSPVISVNAYLPLDAVRPVYLYHSNTSSPAMPSKAFNRMGDVNLSSIRLFTGLTTNFAKATLFMHNPLPDADNIVYYTGDTKDAFSGVYTQPSDHKSLNIDEKVYKNVTFIPAFSALLINEEFRVGGAVFPFLDADFLATYAWYPNISKLVDFTHMSGHDIFVGAEVSSRIPVINFNVKAGVQVFFGQAHISVPGTDKDHMIHESYNDGLQFVVTAGFTLGGRRSRGPNMLRVF